MAVVPRAGGAELPLDLLQEMRGDIKTLTEQVTTHLAIHREQDRQSAASRQSRTALAGASGGLIAAIVTFGLKYLGVG